jgi:hypothetical protein
MNNSQLKLVNLGMRRNNHCNVLDDWLRWQTSIGKRTPERIGKGWQIGWPPSNNWTPTEMICTCTYRTLKLGWWQNKTGWKSWWNLKQIFPLKNMSHDDIISLVLAKSSGLIHSFILKVHLRTAGHIVSNKYLWNTCGGHCSNQQAIIFFNSTVVTITPCNTVGAHNTQEK